MISSTLTRGRVSDPAPARRCRAYASRIELATENECLSSLIENKHIEIRDRRARQAKSARIRPVTVNQPFSPPKDSGSPAASSVNPDSP